MVVSKQFQEIRESWQLVSSSLVHLGCPETNLLGGGSEEILAQLALREEAKDLFMYHKAGAKL